MFSLLLVLLCACEARRHHRHSRGQRRHLDYNAGRWYTRSSEEGRPRLRVPRRSRYDLFRKLGKHLAPYDYSFLKESSATDRRIAGRALQEMAPQIARIMRHYKVAGRERGDYEFDLTASDVMRSIAHQAANPSIKAVMLRGLIAGFTQ